jgi:hypothetical protein
MNQTDSWLTLKNPPENLLALKGNVTQAFEAPGESLGYGFDTTRFSSQKYVRLAQTKLLNQPSGQIGVLAGVNKVVGNTPPV